MPSYRAALLAVALLVPGVAPAQVYKCTGKDGRVHYSQTKPRDADCEETRVAAPPPSGANVDEMVKHSRTIDQARQKEAGQRQQAEQQQAQKQALCNAARSRLALLGQSHRVFIMDEKGERHYQDDTQRRQLEDSAQQAVARECG